MSGVLSADALMGEAARAAGLGDFGDLPFREALEAQVWGLEHESGHPPEALPALAEGLKALLVKRLRLVDDRKRHRAIAAETVTAPIFIVGLPRTGSTHLHALMATLPGARAPLQWELNEPSPPPDRATFDTDPRIAEVQRALDARPGVEEMMTFHPFGAQRPEQCIGLLDWSFVNSAALSVHRMPSYFEWFLGADHRPAYEHHRRMLQHLQWRNPGQWMLKSPKHVFSLDALLDVYPDARIVWTHRDPAKVLPSVINFVGAYRRRSSPLWDPARFAREWIALEEIGLLRGMAVRDRLAGESRFFDLHYNDLVADPVAAVAATCAHFGVAFEEDARARLAAFQNANPKDKHGRHAYAAETYGLDSESLRRRFAPYIERFGVTPDRSRG